jgi:hypothetical protein
MTMNFFKDRHMLIATRHAKELVIEPLMTKNLGVKCFTPTDFDTDQFGTFSGEIDRKVDALTTLRAKIHAALTRYGYDLGIGSEGSFGPHPQLPFVAADEEWVMLVDRKREIEVSAVLLTTDTNFRKQEVKSMRDLTDFLKAISFPQHGITLRHADSTVNIHKGIISWDDLYHAACTLGLGKNTLLAETDMRALFNPTRMKVIKEVVMLLLEKLKKQCPVCTTPGFSAHWHHAGLPCEVCGVPTRLTKEVVLQCAHCHYQEIMKTDSIASAQYCDHCNP